MTDRGERLEQKLAEYQERGVNRIKLGLTDIDGVIRGKYVGLDKFVGLMTKGGGFCDCIFGWDVDDQLYDAGTFTGWHTGFPDARFRLLADSERWLVEEGCPFFIGEFVDADDGPHPLCPRTRLKLMLDRLASHGHHANLHPIGRPGPRSLQVFPTETLWSSCCPEAQRGVSPLNLNPSDRW